MDNIRKDCIFCRITDKDMNSALVYEDSEIVAFRDIKPVAPVHILIIPKKHIASLAELTDQDSALLGRMLLVAKQLAEQEGIAEDGYRVLTNIRDNGGQVVPHLHFHLIGGRKLAVDIA